MDTDTAVKLNHSHMTRPVIVITITITRPVIVNCMQFRTEVKTVNRFPTVFVLKMVTDKQSISTTVQLFLSL